MSVGKKHALADDDVAPVSDRVKKAKTVSDTSSTATDDDNEAPVVKEKKPKKDKKEKKDKREKKDKKDKKDRKEKKERKEKKRKEREERSAETSEAPEDSDKPSQVEPVESEAPKEKKQKKAKKDKSDVPSTNGKAKYTYQQTEALSAVPEKEIQDFLTAQEITVADTSRNTDLRPILKFNQLPPSRLLAKGPFKNFTAPTPIQSASWPFSLSGRDVIGIAETGSGKTLAFSLPCIEALQSLAKPDPIAAGPLPMNSKLNKTQRADVAQALAVVVSPTRELAMQTHAAMADLAALAGLSAVCLYGGASKDDQRMLLRKKNGADIIVATPGRLKDFLSDGTVSLASARFVVLDEADRMLDKGFEDDVKEILGQCPARGERQTLMFTATWPTSVRSLAESFMVDPVKITIGGKTKTEDGEGNGTVELQANSRITQRVEVVDPRNKEWRLLQILKEAQQGKGRNDRILVFCLYKKEAVRVESYLSRNRIQVASIHGDLKQEQRTRSLEAFKAGTTSVLVATDVAARGLDIPEVKLVVNVTFPLTIEDYVHRIGRTGRAGKTGEAITLFTEHDKTHSGSLINILKSAGQPVPEDLMKFGTTVKKKAHDTYGAFFKDVDMSKKGTKITFD